MKNNIVILLGNVGNAPDVVNLDNGTKIASFSLATSENYKDKQGEWIDHSEWHNIKCFGYVAEKVSKIVDKGSMLHVVGKLRTESWEADGQKKYKTVIIADSVDILNRQKQDTTQDIAADYKQPDVIDADDDLPF